MTTSGDTVLRTVLDRLSALSRYDLLLAVVPIAFLCSLAVGQLLSLPPRHALASGAVVGALALVDGLFLNPPRDRGV
ncbi:MAG: hypothetical protein ABEJ23_04375 [Haloarculaceae archaeon]